MIFNIGESKSGGTSGWEDITDQIVPTECTLSEDFKAYLINNNLVMFGSFEVSPYYSDLPLITIPQSFNYVVGAQQNSDPMTLPTDYSGDQMSINQGEDFTEIYVNIELMDSSHPIYISIFATNIEV